jgi:hypothetical protein
MDRHSEVRPRPRTAGLCVVAVAWGAACGDIDQREVGVAPAMTVAGASGTGQPPAAMGGAGSGAAGSGGSSGGAAGGDGGAGGAGQSGSGASGSSGNAGSAADLPNCARQLLINGGFEAGLEPWVPYTTGADPLIYDAATTAEDGIVPYEGQRMGWLGGVPNETNRLSQEVILPAGTTRVTLGGALRIQIFEQHALIDFLRADLVAGALRIPVFAFDNGSASEDWVELAVPAVDVTAYAGQTVTLELESEIGAGPGTNFFIDGLSLTAPCTP